MTLKAYIILALVAAWLGSMGLSYYKGYQYKATLCNTDNLEAKILTLEDQLSKAKVAAIDAERREKLLMNEADNDGRKLDEYEAALKDAPSCRATQRDIDQLR